MLEYLEASYNGNRKALYKGEEYTFKVTFGGFVFEHKFNHQVAWISKPCMNEKEVITKAIEKGAEVIN